MIDKFNELYTNIATAVRTAHTGAFVTGERIPAPEKFPCVAIIEADRYEDQMSVDNSLTEKLVVMMLEVNIFSNKQTGKRSECVGILSTVTDTFKSKNGRMLSKVEGYFDQKCTIYMIQARFRLATDGTHWYTY